MPVFAAVGQLIAERVAVASYTEICQWLGDKDPTTRRVFEELLAQEEEHADDLRGLLERIPKDRPVDGCGSS